MPGICLGSALMFLSWFPAPVTAAEAPTGAAPTKADNLRLEDAIRIALKNHPRVRAAGEVIEAQRAVLGQEMSAYYPNIQFDNFYRSSLASGTTSTSQKAFDFFSSQGRASLTLYDFGKREGKVQSARDSLDATRYAYQTSADEVVLGVKQAYYRYLAAEALVKVNEDTVKDRELLVRQTKGFYEVGTKPKIDVVRAESNLFTARADLITAENGVKVGWATLKNAMGVNELSKRPVVGGLSFIGPQQSLEKAQKVAVASRAELKDLDAQRKSQDQKIAAARRGHLPDIIFNGSYGRRNTSRGGNTFPLGVFWTAQISLNIPIFDGFETTNQVQEAVHNYRSVKAQEEEKKQAIALEVETSYLKLTETKERLKATKAAAKAAHENLELANGRYQVGVGSIIEITDAQVLDTTARTDHIRALLEFKIAEAQLAKATGHP